MRKLLTLLLISCTFMVSAQYVIDPVTKKRVTYSIGADYKFTFSNGRVAMPAVEDIEVKKVYARAIVPPVIPPIVKPPIVKPPVTAPSIVWVTVNPDANKQVKLDNMKDVNIKIPAGKVSNISISNSVNIKIDATGVILANYSGIDIQSPTNVELYGFTITDHSYRAINIRGLVQKLYIHDATFKNIGNTVISFEYAGAYDGTDKTVNLDITLERLNFTNCSNAVGLNGGLNLETGKVIGLSRNFKFINNIVKDCPGIGQVVWAGATDHYTISGNLVDHVNYNFKATDAGGLNGIHNGIFSMSGNGSFTNNKVLNFQGNLIRAWGLSFGKAKDSVVIHNNIAFNSTKYSAFELQAPPYFNDFIAKYPGVLNYTDARVSNNTAGQMNTVKDWEGQMLDLYQTGGGLVYRNNLGFNMNRVQDNKVVPLELGRSMINMGPSEQKDGNRYFTTWQEAVTDLVSFKSKYTGVGAQ